MKKTVLLLALAVGNLYANAQSKQDSAQGAEKQIYQHSATKINDLVHTKLDVKFNYAKSQMNGKAWITLQPHFYATDSLRLDAKGMDIKAIEMMKGAKKLPLRYTYDSTQLLITLDKNYKGGEQYTIYIDYVAKPNELKATGSEAITDAKGLYFINPMGEDKDKPTQIWTQGETEANSAWMPTIDKPNQKSTEEIYMTVPAKYVTLSNGLLMSQTKNADGTRTDYWKMSLPHAPYLFFMGVGDFAIVKDRYKAMEVNYYVEKKYESVARKIFGLTPKMIGFFESALGVPYAWPKYAQMVGRDYVSGAMENTTATLHQESAYQNARQLVDGNKWEGTIAHELFHQWFGDLVTAESWSNLTVNESFANYSEYLWNEHQYGKDAAYEHNLEDMQGYLMSSSDKKDLVRFHYDNKEDMFDAVSYNKGGRILNMLRNYVGDDAFFKSLNNYLTTNKFKAGEAQQLRLAFEEVTGQDLNWFWNQWYYGSGHPKLKIDYQYNDDAKQVQVIIEQTQKTDKVFRLPIAIDLYTGASKVRKNVWVENKIDTFAFAYTSRPDLINVDGDKLLLCEKTDNKTAANFIHQMKYAPNYMDRREALDYFNKKAMPQLRLGLKDPFAGLRTFTINRIGKLPAIAKDAEVISAIEKLAKSDPDKTTQAAALSFLVKTKDAQYLPLFTQLVSDSSYSVAGAALEGLTALQPEQSYVLAKQYSSDAKGALGKVITEILLKKGTEADFDFISTLYKESPASQEKVAATNTFLAYLLKVNDVAEVKKGLDYIFQFRNLIPEQYRGFIDQSFKQDFDNLSKAKGSEIESYITSGLK